MEFGLVGSVVDWFLDAVNWSGEDGIPNRTLEHVWLSFVSVTAAMVVALPLGLLIGHTGRGAFVAISIGNLGQAIPSFAILALTLPLTLRAGLGLGFWPTFVALFFLAIPPILTNTYTGIAGVDRDTVEAARGMGMSGGQILRKLELPLAAPVIAAGVRTAAVQVVATATLAALIAGGTLGLFIVRGFRVNDNDRILGGAILVAVLAILTELALGALERRLRPRTSTRRRKGGLPEPADHGAPGGAPVAAGG